MTPKNVNLQRLLVYLICLLSISLVFYNITTIQSGNGIKLNETNINDKFQFAHVVEYKAMKTLLDAQKIRNRGWFGDEVERLAPEYGGEPLKSIIITTWRSGSTFLADILKIMQGNFYHYEPFLHYGNIQIRDDHDGLEAIQHIKKLLKCDYEDLDEYIEFGRVSDLFTQHDNYWTHCRPFCFSKKYLTKFCREFPYQSMKIVRLRLSIAGQLLEDETIRNLKMIYLIRDPRATMFSRQDRVWCHTSADCIDPQIVCNDLKDDYFASQELQRLYPDNFKIIRYEDLAMEPFKEAEKILKFLNRPFSLQVKTFLGSHTKFTKQNKENTYRNSESVPTNWMLKINSSMLENVQKDCKETIDLWQYKLIDNLNVRNGSEFTNFTKNFYLTGL